MKLTIYKYIVQKNSSVDTGLVGVKKYAVVGLKSIIVSFMFIFTNIDLFRVNGRI